MPKFNLLKEIKNTRNTVLPDTPVPGQSRSKFSIIWLGLALISAGAAVFTAMGIVSVSYSPGRTPPIIIDFTGSGKTVDDTGIPQRKLANAVKKRRPAMAANADEPAPDETRENNDSSKEAPALISRPIAEKAVRARGKPESTDVWYIRFAVCVIKKSCERIVTRLKEKGMDTHIVKGMADLTTNRAIAGPWPTGAHAREAIKKLGRDERNSSIFTSGGRFFFSTEPLKSKAVAEEECGKIRASGGECRLSSKIEARRVYKIYGRALKSRRDAVKKRIAYLKRGIDCVVESN